MIYCSDIDLKKAETNLQENINRVFHWYSCNRLTLSTEKCNTMIISNKVVEKDVQLNIYLGSEKLQQVDSVKYLGLTFDENLKWGNHISNIAKRVNINTSRIGRVRKIIPLETRIQFHNSLSIPVIDYASTVWGNFSEFNNSMIERIEHRAARAITGNYDFIDSRGASIMADLGMPDFITRHKYHTALLMYKSIHGHVPDHIQNMILFAYEVNGRNLRSFDNMDLYKIKRNYEIFKKSLEFNGATVWNSLPLHVKESTSITGFKSFYKQLFYPT